MMMDKEEKIFLFLKLASTSNNYCIKPLLTANTNFNIQVYHLDNSR